MSFLTPLFFLGVAALAAPILVHLVRRTRARRVQFPALIFVRQVPQRTIRRRRLHNLLLLALRCLAILLIVIAFTRPFFRSGSAAKDNNAAGATVILIDDSLSMRRDQLFSEAQKRAEAAVDDARNDEQIALLSFDKRYTVVNRFTPDKNKVRFNVRSLSAGWEGTDYEQALRGAESLLNEIDTSGPKRIVMISDFQAPGWSPASATFKLSNSTQLTTLDLGGKSPPANIAITDVEARGTVFGQKYLDNLVVHVSNFSDIPRDHVQIDFDINEQTVEKRDISLNSRESRVVEFTGFNLNEGANRCTINIIIDDFAPDNRFYFTLRRHTPAKACFAWSQRQPAPAKCADDERGSAVYFHAQKHWFGRSGQRFRLRADRFERQWSDWSRVSRCFDKVCRRRWADDHCDWTTNAGRHVQCDAATNRAGDFARSGADEERRERCDYGREVRSSDL